VTNHDGRATPGRLWFAGALDDNNNRAGANGDNNLDNNNGRLVGIAKSPPGPFMLTTQEPESTLFSHLCSLENLNHAFEKARRRKTLKPYVIAFEKNLTKNLAQLREELLTQKYRPLPLQTFIIRDPKTRKISKSDFRDRIIHHAICNIIEPSIDKHFIHDNYANRKGKGTLKAVERFNLLKRKASRNQTRTCYVLKADVKHYFETVDHQILLDILRRTITDEQILTLIATIIANYKTDRPGKGMPLGNLTSQFFANVYLNELDQYAKHTLKVKHYIRYVDDFVILSDRKDELEALRTKINLFLQERLALALHPDKSKIITLQRGIGFLGFRIFPHHRLLRRKNMLKFHRKMSAFRQEYQQGEVDRETVVAALQGWLAYAEHGNTYKYRRQILHDFNQYFTPQPPKASEQEKKPRPFEKKIQVAERPFTVQKTLLLFKKGKTPPQIAEQRGIKEGTVWEHLANLIEHHQLQLSRIIPKDRTHQIIKHIHDENDTLKDIKSRIGDPTITYNEIACVLASKRSRNGKLIIKKLVQWYQRTNCERKCFMRPEQIAICNKKFEQLTAANPSLTMKKREFLDLFNNHLTICVLPEQQKRRPMTWREFLILRKAFQRQQKANQNA
jgi:retron-type reverse transcriptase